MSLKSISDTAFANCDSLITVTLSNGVNTIGYSAFNDCDALTDVTLPQSLRTLGGSAFANCEVLKNVKFADYSIASLNSSTFSDDPALKSIVISKGCKEIKDSAFKNCTALTDVTIPESVTTIADNAFSYPAKMTIYGYTDSYAKTYADNKGIKFVDNHVLSEGLALSDKFDQYYDDQNDTYNFVLDRGESITVDFDFYPADSNDVVTLKSNNNNAQVNMMDVKGNYSGDSVITATATGGADFEFNVHVRGVSSITLKSLPNKLTYVTGEAFNPDELVVQINYDDKTTAIADPSTYTVTEYDANKNAKQTLKVTYTAKNGSTYQKTFEVEVMDEKGHLTGIKINKLPDKLKYIKGEAFDKTGMVVLETYDSGAEVEITDYTVSGYNALKTGEQTITVKKGDYTAAFKVTVYKDSIPTEPTEPVTDTLKDEDTDVSVDVEGDDTKATLKVEELDEADVDTSTVGTFVAAYNITLLKNNVEIQPNNKVKVRIPCDDPNAKVYRVEADGSLTDMKAVYENGYLVFTTDHFSVYIVAEDEEVLLGDVDGDGTVTIIDATYIQRKLASLAIPFEFNDTIADTDEDGSITIIDATYIQRWLASLQSNENIGKPLYK